MTETGYPGQPGVPAMTIPASPATEAVVCDRCAHDVSIHVETRTFYGTVKRSTCTGANEGYIDCDCTGFEARSAPTRPAVVPDAQVALDAIERERRLREALANLTHHAAEHMLDHEDATMLYDDLADFAEVIDKARAALATPSEGER